MTDFGRLFPCVSDKGVPKETAVRHSPAQPGGAGPQTASEAQEVPGSYFRVACMAGANGEKEAEPHSTFVWISSSTESEFVSLLSICVAANWRDFFDTESAQERRRQYEAASGGAGAAQELPPIGYSSPRSGEPGVRLLKSVSVTPKVSAVNDDTED